MSGPGAAPAPDHALERSACPMGCAPGDERVLQGPDRLHGVGGIYTVVRCRNCGLMRTDPRPAPQQMPRFYPDDYKPHLDTRAPPRSEIDAVRPVRKARKRFPAFDPLNHALPELPAGRMLEIGCASGRFLAEMYRQGWEVQGLEFAERAAQAARAAGYPVEIASLEDARTLGAGYDLVVGWMVLEHLYDPVRSLRILHDLARPGATLALSVPDAGSWEFRFFRDYWYALQLPTHLFHFTAGTLTQVLARGGWRVERVLWQRDAKNLLNSLRYLCLERGWTRSAALLQDMTAGKRLRRPVRWLARALGGLRASGRLTVWARRA